MTITCLDAVGLTITDYLAAASLVVSVLALLCALGAVILSSRWNRVTMIAAFADDDRLAQLNDALAVHLARIKLPVDSSAKLTPEQAQLLLDDPNADNAARRLLTYFERLSAAVNFGVLNDDLAYHFIVGRVVNTYDRFENYIKLRQDRLGDPEILCEFSALAKRWRTMKARRKVSAVGARGNRVGLRRSL